MRQTINTYHLSSIKSEDVLRQKSFKLWCNDNEATILIRKQPYKIVKFNAEYTVNDNSDVFQKSFKRIIRIGVLDNLTKLTQTGLDLIYLCLVNDVFYDKAITWFDELDKDESAFIDLINEKSITDTCPYMFLSSEKRYKQLVQQYLSEDEQEAPRWLKKTQTSPTRERAFSGQI